MNVLRLAGTILTLCFIWGAMANAGHNQKSDKSASPSQGQGGNGGAGLQRDGMILTIGDIKIPLQSTDIRNIPGLKDAQDGIKSLPFDPSFKDAMLQALAPSIERRYFNIKDGDVDPATRIRLTTQYGVILKDYDPAASNGDVRLLGMTPQKSGDTYLLPDFYNLKDDKSRAALLFHEALRVYDPSIDTTVIVKAEVAFLRYLRGWNDIRIIYELCHMLFPISTNLPDHNPAEISVAEILTQSYMFYAYINHDLKNGAFGPKYNIQTGVPAAVIINSKTEYEPGWEKHCYVNPKESLLATETQFPSSLVIQFLLKNSDKNFGGENFPCADGDTFGNIFGDPVPSSKDYHDGTSWTLFTGLPYSPVLSDRSWRYFRMPEGRWSLLNEEKVDSFIESEAIQR